MRKAMNAEYPGKPVSNAAEAAMVSAGYGGNAFKSPTVVYKTIWINKETKEVVSYEEVLKTRAKDKALETVSQAFEGDAAGQAIVTPGLEIFAENNELHSIYSQIAMDQIAAEGGDLSLQNIENKALKLWLRDYLTAQIQDPGSVKPSLEGFMNYANNTALGNFLYKTGAAAVGITKGVGTFVGDMMYASDAAKFGNGNEFDRVMSKYTDPMEKKVNEIVSDTKYAFSSPERFFSASFGFGMGCFYTLSGKPLYEIAGSIETYYSGTTQMTDFFESGYSGLDNFLIDIFGMDCKAYNVGTPAGEITMTVAIIVQSVINAKAAKAKMQSSASQGANKTGTVWDDIVPTANDLPNTNIPATFQMQVGEQTLWTNSNATKHMGEYIGRLGAESWTIEIRSQAMLSSYYSAVEEAMSTYSSLSTGNIFGTFGGWELGINTETGVIFHAIMR